jgi:probable F420-dependent oxidoreductase
VRDFRFGVVFTGQADAKEWPAFARRVEDAGFSTLLVADHYTNPMACGPLIASAASATTTLRVGSYVYNNDFRPPALLAKEAATIDVLSGGRLELGLGAGWAKAEYVLAGLMFDPPGVRLSRFEESIGVIKRLLAGEAVEHRGEHHRLRGLTGSPMPVQHPIPLLIGGGGPRMLRVAAREADIVGFVPPSRPGGGLDPDGFAASAMDERVAAFEGSLAAQGRADDAVERSVLVFATGNDRGRLHDEFGVRQEMVAESPFALLGDTAAMADALHERRERWGLSYTVCFGGDIDTFAPVIDAVIRTR